MRVWIDTDIGSDVDDALALGYALRHPEIEVVLVTTVFGDVELRSRIARALLERGDAPEVPVVTGLGTPLTPGRQGRMFGHEGIGLFAAPSPQMVTEADDDPAARVEQMALALEQTKPDAVLAIGPMTNLGALVEAGVALPPLTVMGGKTQDVLYPGMIPQIPEWNWYCDPLAVKRVLGANGKPIHVVPAEVTFPTHLVREDLERLAEGDALARALAMLSEHWLEALVNRLGSKAPAVALHDPLAAATLVAPLCEFQTRHVEIDDRGGTTHVPQGARIEVAEPCDNDALRRHLLSIWLGESGLDGA